MYRAKELCREVTECGFSPAYSGPLISKYDTGPVTDGLLLVKEEKYIQNYPVEINYISLV
jgi:hypothetical protein